MKLKNTNPLILAANNRTVRLDGQAYIVRAQKLGTSVLADFEPMPQGGTPTSLFARTVTARNVRDLVEGGLFS